MISVPPSWQQCESPSDPAFHHPPDTSTLEPTHPVLPATPPALHKEELHQSAELLADLQLDIEKDLAAFHHQQQQQEDVLEQVEVFHQQQTTSTTIVTTAAATTTVSHSTTPQVDKQDVEEDQELEPATQTPHWEVEVDVEAEEKAASVHYDSPRQRNLAAAISMVWLP